MKLTLFTAILMLSSIVDSININDLQDIFSKIEKEQVAKSIDLKRIKCKRKQHTGYDLKETIYFLIVPPVYKEVLDTITTIDPEKFKPEMRAGYELVTEQKYTKKAGFKWTQTNTGLSFEKEQNEFARINLVVLNIYPNHSSEGTNWTLINQQRKRAYEMIEEAKTTVIFKSQVIQKNGYLKRISKADFLSCKNKQDIIVLKKGHWEVSASELP